MADLKKLLFHSQESLMCNYGIPSTEDGCLVLRPYEGLMALAEE